MSESKHARLSPSGSSRWGACAGSSVLEADEPNNDTEYSREGTVAHALAAHCLVTNADPKKVRTLVVPTKTDPNKSEVIPQDMAEHIQDYIDFVREKAKGHHLMVEQGLSLEWLTGEKGAEGTADVVILKDDGTLHLIDLKYGFQEVSAQDNSQLRIYGLCAAEALSMFGEFKQFELGIYQPRINNFDSEKVTRHAMLKFEEKVRVAVKRVEEARKSNTLNDYLVVGDHCRWCRAAAKCPKLAQEVVEETMVDFEDETQSTLMEPVNLSKAGAKLEMIEGWIRGVRRKIELELFANHLVKGWKLVQGKQGNREFIDEDEAKEKLKKVGVPEASFTKSVMLSVAQLEKKLKGNQKALDLLPSLYGRSPGKIGVAPLGDPRPSYTMNPEDDFTDVE